MWAALCLALLFTTSAASSNCSVVISGAKYDFDGVFLGGASLQWSGLVESVDYEVSLAVNVCGQAEMPGVACPAGSGVCAFVPDAGETDNAGFFANATFSAMMTGSKGALVAMKGQAFPAMMSQVFLLCNPEVAVATVVRVDVEPFDDHAVFSVSVEAAAACPAN